MLRIILLWLMSIVSLTCLAQQPADKKLYLVKDTVITYVDTIDLIHTKLKLGIKAKKAFSFNANQGDTIFYSLKKENKTKMKFWIINANDERTELPLGDSIKNVRLNTEGGTGTYQMEFKNRSFKKNNVFIDLTKVTSYKKTEKLKIEPPYEDSVTVLIKDTIPRIVMEGTYYLGARKNIKAESKMSLQFSFEGDSIPCYWSYMVGFGKGFEEEVNNLINIETQQPVGDPVFAYFKGQNPVIPVSKSARIVLNLTGSTVNEEIRSTSYGTFKGKPGTIRLTVLNKDEVVGEYVYFKVMAIDFVKISELKVPRSEYHKMKLSTCTK